MKKTSSCSPDEASSSQWTPSTPRTFAISCGSATIAVVPSGSIEAGELVDEQLHRLEVHVRVDEARDDVAARRVDRLAPLVRAEPGDHAVDDRDVALEPFAREDRQDAAAADDEVGGLVSASDGDCSFETGHRG